MRINIRETNGNGDTIPVFESVTCCFNGIYELIALPFNRETEKYIRLDTARNLGTWTFHVVSLSHSLLLSPLSYRLRIWFIFHIRFYLRNYIFTFRSTFQHYSINSNITHTYISRVLQKGKQKSVFFVELEKNWIHIFKMKM